MSKRCVVPGCSTGDPAEVKKRKLLQEKQVTLFGVPKVINTLFIFLCECMFIMYYLFGSLRAELMHGQWLLARQHHFSRSTSCANCTSERMMSLPALATHCLTEMWFLSSVTGTCFERVQSQLPMGSYKNRS